MDDDRLVIDNGRLDDGRLVREDDRLVRVDDGRLVVVRVDGRLVRVDDGRLVVVRVDNDRLVVRVDDGRLIDVGTLVKTFLPRALPLLFDGLTLFGTYSSSEEYALLSYSLPPTVSSEQLTVSNDFLPLPLPLLLPLPLPLPLPLVVTTGTVLLDTGSMINGLLDTGSLITGLLVKVLLTDGLMVASG